MHKKKLENSIQLPGNYKCEPKNLQIGEKFIIQLTFHRPGWVGGI